MADQKTFEIDQDLAFQRREWMVQRVGWWVLVSFVLAALAGLFGGGPLSRARAGTVGRFSIEYERFGRVGATSLVTVRDHAALGARASSELRIARSYFDSVSIERVTPEPGQIEIGEADVVLRFETQQEGPALTVVLEIKPRRAGLHRAAFANGQGAELSFSQLTYF